MMILEKTNGNIQISEKLSDSIKENRISHAQLFSGKVGWAMLNMALAYVAEIFSAEKDENAAKRVLEMQHPDVHFSFPVYTTPDNDKPTSNDYFKEWREFILAKPFSNMFDWLDHMEVPKKTGTINVHEAAEINRFLSLNAYEGGYKCCIIWLAETMRNETANKLLKSIEEPPDKTIFILITEREDLLLPTIISRCQTVKFNRLSDQEIGNYLSENTQLSEKQIQRISAASNGDLREAIQTANESNEEFEDKFIDWVRNAFRAKNQISALNDLVVWTDELSLWPREKQKQFLIYCSEIFRQALLQNYQLGQLVYVGLDSGNFKWDNFTKYIHGSNIEAILDEINQAAFHIERNANAKIVFLDLSIKLTRFIHRKAG